MIHVCEQGETQRTNNERVSISKVIPHFLVYNETILCTHICQQGNFTGFILAVYDNKAC